MMMCCIRLTFSTSRTCGSMSPLRKPRSMMPRPPSSAWTIAIGARVTVSMLADTSGRLSVMWVEKRHDRSISDGIAALDDAELRAQQEVVERGAANQLRERIKARGHSRYFTVSLVAFHATDLQLDPASRRSPRIRETVFVRHRWARRYILRVLDDGTLRVTLPRWGSKREAQAFVEQSAPGSRHGSEGARPAVVHPDETVRAKRAARNCRRRCWRWPRRTAFP